MTQPIAAYELNKKLVALLPTEEELKRIIETYNEEAGEE